MIPSNSNKLTKASSIKSILLFLVLICFSSVLMAQNKSRYFDGPYVFNKKDSLYLQWIEYGKGFDTTIAIKDAGLFKRDSLPEVDLQNLDFEIDEETNYHDIKKVVAVSDVHGQFDLLILLLQSHGIIDELNNWNYKNGHLLVLGDNLDRGDQALEILWFLFYLQKEAEAQGGKVHMMLGNHEIMNLNGDLRYLNKKYYYTSAIFTTPYNQFFRAGSILGDWIASHKVMTVINQRLFVHAGISPAIIQQGYSMKEINKIFRDQLVRKSVDSIEQDNDLSKLYGIEGPLWYRGLLDETVLNEDSINYILESWNVKSIIIGHTSYPEITSLFNNKIVVIDCSIKLGHYGQLLFLEGERLYVGDSEGEKFPIDLTSETPRKSLFDFIHQLDSIPKMKIDTDVRHLIRGRKEEFYQSGNFNFTDYSNNSLLKIPGRIRARGNKRKMVCRIPPIKIDFKKSQLDSLGFFRLDKLKLVLPCYDTEMQQELLFKEFFVYELYNLIDTNGIRTKLIDITLGNTDEKSYAFTGFLIEHEKDYAKRKNAIVLNNAKINSNILDRPSFVNMVFFQYMIANTDWATRNRHNLEMVKLKNMKRVTAIPYDFDYSGFVGQSYAIPPEVVPIESVHDRYFYPYKVTKAEFDQAVDYFLSLEKDMYTLCEKATYMKSKTIRDNRRYLESFFDLLRQPERLWKEKLKNQN